MHRRGEHSEDLVVGFFTSRQYVLKARRWKTPFAEVDLLFRHRDEGWLMVEVKTLDHFDPLDMLSDAQLQRLRRAAEFVMGRLGEMPRLVLAAVNHLERIQVLPLE